MSVRDRLAWAIGLDLWNPLDLDLPLGASSGGLVTTASLQGFSVTPAAATIGAVAVVADPGGFTLWQLTTTALGTTAVPQSFELRNSAGAFGEIGADTALQSFDLLGIVSFDPAQAAATLQTFNLRPTGIQPGALVTTASLAAFTPTPQTPFGALVTGADLAALAIGISTGATSVERVAIEARFETFELRNLNPGIAITPLQAGALLGTVGVRQLVVAAFPPLEPSQLTFSPPQHAITRIQMEAGNTVLVLEADEPGAAGLDLEFRNIPDSAGLAIWQSHERCSGNNLDFALPDEVVAYATLELRAFLQLAGTTQRWTFRGEPSITDAKVPGRCSARVQLRSRRAPSVARLPPPILPPCDLSGFEDTGTPVRCDTPFTPGGSCTCSTISGTPAVGQTLSLGPVVCTDGDATITGVTWLRDGVPIWTNYSAFQLAPASDPPQDLSANAPLLIDSQGNSYAALWGSFPHVAKTSPQGTLMWVKSYRADGATFAPTTGLLTRAPRIAFDPQGRLWLVFTRYRQDVSGNSPDHRLRVYFCRLNTDTGTVAQTVVHQFRMPTSAGGDAGVAEAGITDMVIDSSGNFWLCGARRVPSTALLQACVYQYNSSLAYQWGKLLPAAGADSTIARRIVVAQGRGYVAIDSDAGSGSATPFVAVLDDTGSPVISPASGTLSDQLVAGGSATKRIRATSLTVDSTGSIYVAVAADPDATRQTDRLFGILRLSPILSVSWSRFFRLTGAATLADSRAQLTDLQLDGTSILALGFCAGDAHLLQINASGNVLRHRRLSRGTVALQNDTGRLAVNRSGTRVVGIHGGRGNRFALDPDATQAGTYDIPGVTPDLVITSIQADAAPQTPAATLTSAAAVDEPSRSTLQTDVVGVDSEAPFRDLAIVNLVPITA